MGGTISEFTNLKSVIDYAISREQEAVDFYSDLSKKMKTKGIAEELLKLAKMEKGHSDRLKKLDLSAYASSDPKMVQDLKIADFLVDKEPTPKMGWKDVVHIAITREAAALKLYTAMANLSLDPSLKGLFLNLAAEEGTHKNYFEKVWDEDIMYEN